MCSIISSNIHPIFSRFLCSLLLFQNSVRGWFLGYVKNTANFSSWNIDFSLKDFHFIIWFFWATQIIFHFSYIFFTFYITHTHVNTRTKYTLATHESTDISMCINRNIHKHSKRICFCVTCTNMYGHICICVCVRLCLSMRVCVCVCRGFWAYVFVSVCACVLTRLISNRSCSSKLMMRLMHANNSNSDNSNSACKLVYNTSD